MPSATASPLAARRLENDCDPSVHSVCVCVGECLHGHVGEVSVGYTCVGARMCMHVCTGGVATLRPRGVCGPLWRVPLHRGLFRP